MLEYTVKVWPDGTKRWYLNGERHREDGPAVERCSGSKEWWVNGKRHREDGPAVEWSDGYKEWWINGERHREDGPAVEGSIRTKRWWINGKQVTEEEHSRLTSGTKELTVEQIEQLLGHKVKVVGNRSLDKRKTPMGITKGVEDGN